MNLRIINKDIYLKRIKNYKKNLIYFSQEKKYIIIIFNQCSIVSEHKCNDHSYRKIFYLMY